MEPADGLREHSVLTRPLLAELSVQQLKAVMWFAGGLVDEVAHANIASIQRCSNHYPAGRGLKLIPSLPVTNTTKEFPPMLKMLSLFLISRWDLYLLLTLTS